MKLGAKMSNGPGVSQKSSFCLHEAFIQNENFRLFARFSCFWEATITNLNFKQTDNSSVPNLFRTLNCAYYLYKTLSAIISLHNKFDKICALQVPDLDMREENGSSKSQYIESAEWNLNDVKKQRNAKKYTCCLNKLADISITIVMDRKPLFYLFNLVIPCLIILSMILLGFFLPPESGERITLSITVLLAMAVFLQLVGESLPRNSETVPLLGKFYITIMAEISISLMLTCWVLNIHYHGSGNSAKAVPLWARIVVLQWLGYLLCVGKPDGSSPEIPNTDLRYHQDDGRRKGAPFALDWETTFAPAANCHCTRCINARGALHFNGERSPDESRLIEVRYTGESSPIDFPSGPRREKPKDPKLSEEISVLANSIREREKVEKNQEDWKYFAMVMDRFFFWFYLMTIVISTLTIFLSRTHDDET